MTDELLDKVRRTITAHRLLTSDARVIVAVSGGTDSVALLHALKTLGPARKLGLHIAHLDHRLRDDSAQDAEFVRSLGARWRIPTTIERQDVGATCDREGWSLEEGARRIRHRFFLETAQRQRADYVALAHTADDQAETVLMRLLRGAGLLGLSAIPITRELDRGVRLVRPLLEVWRRDLAAYLEAAGLPFREDPTNADRRFTRNRIRHELLPRLERDYNPNIKVSLVQLAEQSRGDYAYLQHAAGRQWKRMVKTAPGCRLAISVSVFLRQPKALQRQVVRQTVQQVRGDAGQLEFRHWLEVERLFTERPAGTRLDLPGGVMLLREDGRVLCQLAEPNATRTSRLGSDPSP